jgi:hypothetical protein
LRLHGRSTPSAERRVIEFCGGGRSTLGESTNDQKAVCFGGSGRA